MSVFYLVKDYIEVVHKLIETSPNYVLQHSSYTDFLTILNFGLTTLKQFCSNLLSFQWLNQLWYFPIIIPEIATSMLEEISVFDGNFHNVLTFLDKPIAIGNQIYGSYYLPVTLTEKFFTGFVNSLFIWLPTSTATFLCFRRFIMQGVEAGYAAALGTMSASLFWFASILFGLRFIVVPWMSLDLFRYWLGFLLLMKYFWDNRYAYKEVKHNSVFGKQTKRNIFGFHFLLALTEQSSLYPFLNNFSISSQSTMLESFQSENFFDFSFIHFSYLLGIAVGSYSLISLICWFWQDPAYRFYFWIMNKFKKLRIADIVRPVHLFFQTLTVLFAFSSLPYYGIEYQIANPLGFLPNDQVFHQFKQTSFLTHPTSPAYYRSRLNFPRQKFFRYEDWAEYYHRNTPIDTSLYDQGAYRLYTMEDLSYGKDYEWMRRRSDKIKIRSRLKRLRWFPRNWANRLWEFTKTWSRRNVFWRNDILNMYQYSWDSKAPIIWGKLVFEEFFPTKLNQKSLTSSNISNNIETNGEFSKIKKNYFSSTINKPVIPTWDSFWGPDPDWSSKFLWNENSLYTQKKDLWWNLQSRLNLSDNDIWWKWLMTQSSNTQNSKENMFSEVEKLQMNKTKFSERSLKSDFWEPQKRFISVYSDQSNRNESMLEYSILRKFVRKLIARFKLAQIENVSTLNKRDITVSSNSMKTLLLLPSLRDWTVFQTVMTNINQMLWWRCLFLGESKKKISNFNSSTYNSLLTFKNDSKNSGVVKSLFSKQNAVVNKKRMSFVSKRKLSFVSNKLYASKQKFEKLQNKYFQIQLKQTNLNSNLLTSNFSNKLSQTDFTKSLSNLDKHHPDQKGDNSQLSFGNQMLMSIQNEKFQNKLEKNYTKKQFGFSFEKNVSSTLLHPIKYYLHKEENFKKKLSFYGVKKPGNLFNNNQSSNQLTDSNQTIKNSSVVDFSSKANLVPNSQSLKISYHKKNWDNGIKKNNLPIFNFYLKTYFQTYKKTKLYVLNTKMKRQLGMGASARRKGRDYSNKLLKRSKILANTPWIRQWIDQSGFLARRKRLETWITRQHYDPNELWSKIMKLDVDLFMKRQPNAYFLTNTEEKLLHLRRFLLFEHYDSLRWYTVMTNYRTMKNTIGGTKSFTNMLYNQQFKGTFHKVRHLFSLTPSVSNGTLLKFDQSLYNLNNNVNVQGHEELGNRFYFNNTSSEHKTIPENRLVSKNTDLIEKSTQIIKTSIWQNNFRRKKYIEDSLEQKNYNLLTKSVNSLRNPFWKKDSFQNVNNFNNSFKQTSTIKTNLQTKLMISLFRKRQKWTKDYKRSSEKLWKKWKFQNIIKKKPETSVNLNSRESQGLSIFVESKPKFGFYSNVIGGNSDFNSSGQNIKITDQKQLFSNNKIEDSIILNQSKLNSKFVQISKLKKLAGFDKNRPVIEYKFSENNTSLQFLQKTKPLESTMNYALRDGIKLQSIPNNQVQDSKQVNLQNNSEAVIQNNLFTKKLIKERYQKLFAAQSNRISKNLVEQFESPFNFKTIGSLDSTLKFSLKYKLKNILNKRINNNFSLDSSTLKNSTQINNFSKELNLKLYQKNLLRRERSNIQNLVFMKKFLLNDSNLSLTRNQIRPLPGKRTKALYERGSSSSYLSDYYNQNLTKMENKLQSTFLFSPEAGSNVNLKIRAYKNSKWFEETDQESKFNIYLKNIKPQQTTLKIIELNQYLKTFIKKLKNSFYPPKLLLSDKMDETLQKKFLKLQKRSFFINSLNKETISGNLVNELNERQLNKLALNLLLDNQSSRIISIDQKQNLQNSIRQKLTKTILKRALQKVSNSSSSNKNLIEADMPNVIRLTKSLRKRQQDKIVRSLLKRHLNFKSRRKLFLKTKEMNNQRMVIDRNFEIQERLFINKISYYTQFQNNLKSKLEQSSPNFEKVIPPFNSYNEPLNIFLGTKKINNEINSVDKTNSSQQSFSKIQKSTSNIFNNLIGWLNQSFSTSETLLQKKKNSEIFSVDNFDNKLLTTKITKNSFKTTENNYVLENTKGKKQLIKKFIQKKGNPNVLNKDKTLQNKSYLSSLTRSAGFINNILKNEQINMQSQKTTFPEKFLNLKLKEKIKAGSLDSSSLEPEKNVLRRSMRKFFVSDYRTRKNGLAFWAQSRNFETFLKNNLHNYGKDNKNLFINNLFLKNWIQTPIEKNKQYNSISVNPDNGNTSRIQQFISNPYLKADVQKLITNNFSKNELISLNKYVISSRTNPNKLSKQQMRKKLKKRRIIRSKRIERLKTLKDHPLKFRSEQIQTFYNVKDSLHKWKNFSFISQKYNYTKSLNVENLENLKQLSTDINNSSFYSNPIKLADSFDFEQNKSNEIKTNVFSKNFSLTPLKQKFHSKILARDFAKNISLNDETSESNFLLNSDLFYTLYKDLFLNASAINDSNFESIKESNLSVKPLESSFTTTTNMPFYAGWDESVRKFVLTNRLLSRREAGYEIAKTSVYPESKNVNNLENNQDQNNVAIVFSSWPLKGTNAATTLFSQFPFMTAPQNTSNFSNKQTLVFKGGTKYELQEGTTISETSFLRSKLPQSENFSQLKISSTNVRNKFDITKKIGLPESKWKEKLSEKLTSSSDLSKLYIKFKKQKRIKTIIKSSKNEDHVGIRQAGQVISNLATVKNRKAARRNLFSALPWRTKKQTTKSLLKLFSTIKTQPQISVLNSVNSQENKRFAFSKLFVSLNSKNNSIDKKLSAKLLLLRNLRHGNVSQTKLTYLRRLQKYIRPTGSAWKKNISLSRRKKQYIGMNKNVLSSGFIDYFPNRFNVRKRKKRSNNKNPRLRGDKNFKKTKRQYRQKVYLRPKNRPLRRRSLGVLFKNKLNYWRLNYQNLATNKIDKGISKESPKLELSLQSLATGNQTFNQKNTFSTGNVSNLKLKQISTQTSKNLIDNSLYSIKENEWEVANRPKKLYRSLFANKSKSNPLLYQTLPGHNRSIPIIKNLPLPGSSVKTLNRIIKWSSADGAARFYRVNLSYGWALELFLKDLHQKIRLIENQTRVPPLDSLAMNNIINDYLIQLMKTNTNKFSSDRLFKRKSYKLRQLSYTMSMRLYDRWFFYYYKNLNNSLLNKEQTNMLINQNFKQSLKQVSAKNYQVEQQPLTIETPVEPLKPERKMDKIEHTSSIISLFKHIKKILTFHLTDSQITFRSYLKNLRNTAYLKIQNVAIVKEENQQENSKSFNNNEISFGNQLTETSRSSDLTKKNSGLDNFQLFKKNIKQKNFDDEINNYTKENLNQTEKSNKLSQSRSLLKKEKKYAEDRFFFAQFNKPPLVDDYRLTLENNRHYPVNGGFVWPGDYLRLKTILLPKEIKDLYLSEKNKKTIKVTNLNKIISSPIQLDFKGRI